MTVEQFVARVYFLGAILGIVGSSLEIGDRIFPPEPPADFSPEVAPPPLPPPPVGINPELTVIDLRWSTDVSTRSSFVHAHIRNDGEKIIRGLELQLPTCANVRIHRSTTGKTTQQHVCNLVSIGDLKINHEICLQISFRGQKDRDFYGAPIVVHDDGKASLSDIQDLGFAGYMK